MTKTILATAFALLLLMQSVPLEAQGQREAVKVHGHWTIDIRNPDGTLVSHREFENALQVNASANFLPNLLGRQLTVGKWDVLLDGPSGSPCERRSFFGIVSTGCLIVEPSSSANDGSGFSSNLAVISQTFGASPGTVLTGSVAANRTGKINEVVTRLGSCPASVAPASCGQYGDTDTGHFSGTLLATPIDVVSGQIIQVTVRISFS